MDFGVVKDPLLLTLWIAQWFEELEKVSKNFSLIVVGGPGYGGAKKEWKLVLLFLKKYFLFLKRKKENATFFICTKKKETNSALEEECRSI